MQNLYLYTSGNRAKPFLTSCIPDLQFDALPVKINRADFEIYPAFSVRAISKTRRRAVVCCSKTKKNYNLWQEMCTDLAHSFLLLSNISHSAFLVRFQKQEVAKEILDFMCHRLSHMNPSLVTTSIS